MNLISQKLFNQTRQEFLIQADQDGLFFGLEYLQNLLKAKKDTSSFEIKTYFKDGECVFKGHTLMQISLVNTSFKKENLGSLVSYLSGAYTLLSCWTKKHFDFFIMACPTPNFLFSDGEEKAILKSGALIQKSLKNICFHLEDAEQALEKGEKRIILSDFKMSKKQIKNILQSLDPSIEITLYGSFFPLDLEEFRIFHNIKAAYPVCLQGYFPHLPMKIVEI